MTLHQKCALPVEVADMTLVPEHLPRRGRSHSQDWQLHWKGPYLKLPEKGQNTLSGVVIHSRTKLSAFS